MCHHNTRNSKFLLWHRRLSHFHLWLWTSTLLSPAWSALKTALTNGAIYSPQTKTVLEVFIHFLWLIIDACEHTSRCSLRCVSMKLRAIKSEISRERNTWNKWLCETKRWQLKYASPTWVLNNWKSFLIKRSLNSSAKHLHSSKDFSTTDSSRMVQRKIST